MSSRKDYELNGLALEPIKGQRLSTLIVEQLQRAILSGAIPEGARLPRENELIAQFKASRASVLGALHILEANGLIEIRRGALGGAFVCKRDFSNFTGLLNHLMRDDQFELRDIYEARALLEPGIAEIAARLATKADIALLRSCIEFHRQTPPDQPAAVGRNFHYLLAGITGNQLLVMLMSSLLGAAQKMRAQQPLTSRKRRLETHEKIVDAIERGDGKQARSILARYLASLLKETIKDSSS
jgi:DNA-binding FadR family transcriptional regulator